MLGSHKEIVNSYNAASPRWRQISFAFFVSIFASGIFLLVAAPLVLVLIGAPAELKSATSSMAASLSAVGFSICMLIVCANGFYFKRDLLMTQCEFTHEAPANFLAWAYKRGSVIMYMGSVVLMTVLISAAILHDTKYLWVVAYIALAMIALCIGIFVPLEWRYRIYALRVCRRLGKVDHALAALPENLQIFAKHYALFYGNSGVKKAIGIAFIGNHHANRLNAEQMADALDASTPPPSSASKGPIRRL